ncbi:MAG: S8 family serine peptidase [Ferruginibacter sp.]
MRLKNYPSLLILCTLLFCSFIKIFGQVSAETERQIIALLQEKNSRTPAQQKMDSKLIQAIKEKAGQKMAEGTYLLPVDVKADAQGNLKVDISAEVTQELLNKIIALGGKIIYPSEVYHTIRATINLSMAETIAGYPEVHFIGPAAEATTVGMGFSGDVRTDKYRTQPLVVYPYKEEVHPSFNRPSLKQRAERVRVKLQEYLATHNLNGTTPLSGSTNSQGDRTHRADDVRATYGITGQGIRIGVLSDSYDRTGYAAADVLQGDLPGVGNPLGYTTPVTVLQDYTPSGGDEGRAMIQIVHDLAPKAQLFFATAFFSEASFASNIQALRNAPYNCDIIIDDIFYYDEPVFQDGIVAQAVNAVTASGGWYFSSAGNEGNVAKGTAGYYEADFNDAGSLPVTFPTGVKAGTIHNFGTVGSPLMGDSIKAAGNVYALTWSDPAYAPTNDYDLFLINAAGNIKAQSTNTQPAYALAYESVSGTSPVFAAGDKLVVFKTNASAVRAFTLNTNRGTLNKATTGQTHGHSSAVDAFSVAATPAVSPGPYPLAFFAGNSIETFSSDGPRRIFYTAAGTPISGGVTFASGGGTTRSKPDITAADGVSTTLPLNGGLNPFYGTSAAAPHAGAIAALLKAANPAMTATQIRTFLTTTALDIESVGNDINSGYGIVQAFQAMQAVAPAVKADIIPGTVTTTEALPFNSNGVLDPGEGATMTVQLKNPSPVAAATSVTATITTSTPGVTITQSAASYGTIAASGNALNTVTPFAFSTTTAVPCGSVISFNMIVSFTGGLSPQTFPFTVNVGSQPAPISTNLSVAAVSGSTYTAATGTQTGRLSRNGIASTCAALKANPGLVAGGSRVYHAYTFTNTSANSQCVTVAMSSASGTSLYTAAYNSTGFVPATPSTNYLADAGSSTNYQQFSFNVAAGVAFTVVVHDVNNPTSSFAYSLKVYLSACSNVIPVTWLSFTAQPKDKQVALQWKVANEINVSHYEVEYGTDGANFSKLYTLTASNSTAAEKTYSQLHPFPVAGNNYYRIKQVDKDGRFSYSSIAMVRMDKVNPVSIMPNPAKDYVSIRTVSLMNQLQLFNATGQLLMNVKPGNTSYLLNITNLPKGQYSVRIETNNEVINEKIVKE